MKVVSFAPLWRDELAGLLHDGIELVALPASGAALAAADLAAAHILVTAHFDAQLASACPSLELLLCPAAGTESIDRTALPRGVEVVKGIGHEIPIAEYVIGALVSLRQHFISADSGLREGRWRYGFFGDQGFVDELYGSTLGLIGYGRIGVEIARRAPAFGIQCGALTLHPDKPHDRSLLPLGLGSLKDPGHVDRLVRASDAVVLACEYSPITRALIDARRLTSMRPNAVLINVSRGPVADERALFTALQRGQIHGAAIDVWYQYPEGGAHVTQPSSMPFAQLGNVLMTPHCSGWSEAAKTRKLKHLAQRINDWYESRRPAR